MAKSHLHFPYDRSTGIDECCDNSTGSGSYGRNNSELSSASMELPQYMFLYVSILNAFIFLAGVVGNVMVIQVIARMKAMRTRMNYFLMSLSVADLLVLVVCQPSAMFEFYGKDRWLIGEVMCKIVPFLENASLHSSVLTLLTIGFERYYAICHPLRDQRPCLFASTCAFISCIWVSAYILSLPFVFMTYLEEAEFVDGTVVKVCRTKTKDFLPRIYIVFIFCIFFILPMCMLTYMYCSVIKKLFRLNSETSPRDYPNAKTIHSRQQVVRMMVAIVILFFVSLLPIRIVGLWIVFSPYEDVESLGMEFFLNILSVSRIFAYTNSAGNPIIYGLISTKFRNAFSRSMPRCRGRPERRGSFTPRTGSPKPGQNLRIHMEHIRTRKT